MLSIKSSEITAVILAGGRAKRLSGQDKGLILLNQKPLIKYVIDALKNTVSEILISANRHQKQYQNFVKTKIISDDLTDFQGPLAGIAEAMKTSKTPYLLVLPCDCPFVEVEILTGLKNAIYSENAEIAVADDGDRLQPTFALLKTDLLPSLLAYLQKGERKIDLWYQQHNWTKVDFSDHKNYFNNLNTPEDFAKFCHKTSIKNVPIIGFAAFSGVGKTTLITQIIKHLTEQKIRLAYLKHAHHNFEIDHPGKDSFEAAKSGANQVLICSDQRLALISQHPKKEPSLTDLFDKLDLNNLDLILIEGFKSANFNKIELQRKALNHPSLHKTDPNIIALATDTPPPPSSNLITLDLNTPKQITNFILAHITVL